MTEPRYEMLWDCPACGAQGLLGLSQRHCPSCGAAQDPTRRYYPPAGSEIAVENHPFHGADVRCRGCDSPNAAIAKHCVNCGGDLAGSPVVARRQELGEGAGDDARAAAAEHAARKAAERQAALGKHAEASGAEALPAPAGSPGGGKTWKIVAGLVAVAAICCGILSWKREAAAEVTAHAWERSIALEELGPTQETAWREEVPSDATAASCNREKRSTRQIADGQDCRDVRADNGDGTFSKRQECTPRTRDEDVYDERCTYTVVRWHTVETLRAAGAALEPAPAWPDAPAAPTGAGVGARRAGARAETYTLHLQLPDGEEKTCTLPEASWAAAKVGSRWKVAVGTVTGGVDCSAMTPL
jgi:hypothetical protein